MATLDPIPTGTASFPNTPAPSVATSVVSPQPTGLANGIAGPSGTQASTTSAVAPPFPDPQPIPPVASYTPAQGVVTPSVAKGYDPTPYIVPEKGLVQQQIKEIVGADSPLMQQARVKAMQVMNERGLVNSTLNTEAGQNAVIAQALPIAQADAAAYNAAMTNTANAQNMASQFGASAENTASQTNAQLLSTMSLNNASAQNTQLAAVQNAENAKLLATIDNNSKQALALLDTQNRQLLQTNANAANMFQETVKNIAGIAVNEKLSQAAKDAATRSQLNLLNEGLRTTAAVGSTVPAEIEELDLAQYFRGAIGKPK